MAGFSLGLDRTLLPWKRAGVSVLLYDEDTLEKLREQCRPGSSAVCGEGQTAALPRIRQECRPVAGTEVFSRMGKTSSVPVSTPINQTRNLKTIQATPADRQALQQNAPHAGDVLSSRPLGDGPVASEGVYQKRGAGNDTGVHAGKEGRLSSKERYPADTFIQPLPVMQWPASWRTLFDRTPHAPRLIWSYPELADDLLGRGDKQRADAWRKLFADLRLRRGSHAFWPLFPPDGTCDPKFFLSGVHALRPALVALFCPRVPESIGLPQLRMFLPVVHRGIRYVLLYDSGRMVADALQDTPRHAKLVQFITSMLGR